MPFGLSNAPVAFQRAMDSLFREEQGSFLQVYLDDIIIFSKTRDEHEQHLRIVLNKITKAGLKLKKKSLKYLDTASAMISLDLRKRESNMYMSSQFRKQSENSDPLWV